MAALSFSELQNLLQSAGLDSAKAAIGAAIALAESGGRTDAVGDGGTSYGLWQIHLPAHPDVSQACALDPGCAAAAAVRISSGGTDWTPWSTFVSGAYQAFLGQVQAAVHWVVTLRFGQAGPTGAPEVGTDVAVPVGTEVLTPFSGVVSLVEDQGKKAWGKRVLITIDQGPLAGSTFGAGHLTDIAVTLGQHVSAGDVFGHSGGDPSDPSSGNSTGPHVEVQVLNKLGQFVDPELVLGITGLGIGKLFGAAKQTGTGLPNPLASAQQSIGDALTKLGYLLLGLALIWLGIVLLILGSIPWDKVARLVAGATPEGRVASAAAGAAGAAA